MLLPESEGLHMEQAKSWQSPHYKGNVVVRHLSWLLIDDIGLDNLSHGRTCSTA